MEAKLTDAQVEQIKLSSTDVINQIEKYPEQLNQAFLIAEIDKILKVFNEESYLLKMGTVIKVRLRRLKLHILCLYKTLQQCTIYYIFRYSERFAVRQYDA